MNRTVIAALVALSLPAAALADEHREQPRPYPAPAVAVQPRHDAGDRQEVRELERLLSRYDDAMASRSHRELPRLEAELALAFDREIAEARAALPGGFGHERDGHGRLERQGPARAELDRLLALKADFTRAQGRYGRPAMQQKHAAVVELLQLARADVWRGAPAPVAYGWHR